MTTLQCKVSMLLLLFTLANGCGSSQKEEQWETMIKEIDCDRSAIPPMPRSEDYSLLEAVLRELLKDEIAEHSTFYIAIGWVEKEGRDEWIDASPEFLERLSDLKLQFRPASDLRVPQSGEMKSEHQFRGVEDPITGKPKYIHYAIIREWIDSSTVRVEAGMFGGPLSGGGFRAVYEKRDGEWQIKKDRRIDFVS